MRLVSYQEPLSWLVEYCLLIFNLTDFPWLDISSQRNGTGADPALFLQRQPFVTLVSPPFGRSLQCDHLYLNKFEYFRKLKMLS